MPTPAPNTVVIVILNGKVVQQFPVNPNVRVHTPNGAILRGYPTQEVANAAITANKWIPYITKIDKANADLTAIFDGLASADQATYGILFAPVQALVTAGQFAQAVTVINAVTIPDRLVATRTAMLAILHRP